MLLVAAKAAGQAAPVEVVMPTMGQAAREFDLTGSFTARRAAQLSPRMPGLVAEVAVDAGDRVDSGDVLLRLDDDLAALEVRRAEAMVEESRAALTEAERLRDEGARLSAQNHLPETEVEARRSQVALARAAVSRAESELAAAREELARHTVVAPFDGVIASKLTEAGEWVETGTAVLELVDTDELWLDVRAPQRLWAELEPQTEVTAFADAWPNRPMKARVHARVPVNDPSARTFLVRLVVPELDGGVTPGMSARARFQLAAGEPVVQVPRDAIIRYPDGTTTVWVIDDDSDNPKARETQVTLGRYLGDRVEVVAGLDPSQPVIVRGNEVLTEGQAVRLTGSD